MSQRLNSHYFLLSAALPFEVEVHSSTISLPHRDVCTPTHWTRRNCHSYKTQITVPKINTTHTARGDVVATTTRAISRQDKQHYNKQQIPGSRLCNCLAERLSISTRPIPWRVASKFFLQKSVAITTTLQSVVKWTWIEMHNHTTQAEDRQNKNEVRE